MRFPMIAVAAFALLFTNATRASPPPGSYRAYVNGPWGQIHVRVMGPATGPTVVLVHKMVWSSLEFGKAQPFLAKRGVRSIAVDLPGYGLSDGPDTQPSADGYADALVPVLNYFKLQKAVMVGVNTGATIVTAFALRHPDRTTSIVMDGPPVFKGQALIKALAEPEFDRTARRDGATLLARWQDIKSLAKNGGLSDETIQTGLLQFFQAGPHYLFGHQAIFSYDLDTALGRVAVPVMIITYPGDQLRAVSIALAKAHPGFAIKDIAWNSMVADFQAPDAWSNALADYVLRR